MKIIVITGGGRHVGKTTLARALKKLLEDAVVVKLGTHAAREGKPELFFERGTSFGHVMNSIGDPGFVILESGHVLSDPDCDPDLVVFLPRSDGRADKPGSDSRRARADIVRGDRLDQAHARRLMETLGLDHATFYSLLELVGVRRD